jgi:hypothetical protein
MLNDKCKALIGNVGYLLTKLAGILLTSKFSRLFFYKNLMLHKIGFSRKITNFAVAFSFFEFLSFSICQNSIKVRGERGGLCAFWL